MSLTFNFKESQSMEVGRVGAKAANLSTLYNRGLIVPEGFVIAADALEEFLKANALSDQVDMVRRELKASGPGGLTGLLRDLREAIVSGKLTPEFLKEIQNAWRAIGSCAVSVRSSSNLEDRLEFSFAGQHDSFLNVVTDEGMEESIKRCWASLWTDRAMHYLLAIGVSLGHLRMSVLIQRMIFADVSGVAFTHNPVSGDSGQVVISMSYGLGEATVSGEANPDHVVLQREPRSLISYTVGDKRIAVSADVQGGTKDVELPVSLKNHPCLTTEQVLNITESILRVEEEMGGSAQDIEWAVEQDKLYILQARPLTKGVLSPFDHTRWESPVPGAHWRRNWRLGEWLSDPLTPLFATWMLPILVQAREEQGLGYLGWGAPESFAMLEPWFCIVNGYFYTRRDMPSERVQKFGEQTLEERATRMSGQSEWLTHWRDNLLPPYSARFKKHLQYDLEKASSLEIIEFTEGLMREAGEFWYLMAPIGFGFEEMSFKPYYESLFDAEAEEIPDYTVFFSGYSNSSLDGQQALFELADRVKKDQTVADALLRRSPEECFANLGELPTWFLRGFNEYLSEYGNQLYSLDFYFPTMGESPISVLSALQGYVRHSVEAPNNSVAIHAQRREEALRWVETKLAGRPRDRKVMRQVIRGFQAPAAIREDIAFHFQKPWPLIRFSLYELGARLVDLGFISNPAEIFFLEVDEVRSAFVAATDGGTVRWLGDEASRRSGIWEARRHLVAPVRIPVDELDALDRRVSGYIEDEDGMRLLGQAASPGLARGRARLVRSPLDVALFNKGEILVTAAASPAYTPLLLLAEGWVTDAGGGASHCSLIARELGVPAVVGTGVAMETIKDGQLLELDGANGTVSLLGQPPE